MAVTINGTSGITTPGITNTGNETVAGNETVTGDITGSSFNGGQLAGQRNKIINGAMMIDQRNAGAAVTPGSGQYLVDRWVYFGSQPSKFTAQQNAGSVTPPAGFTKYLGLTVAATATVGSGDYFQLLQYIEGLNCSDLAWGTANAKTVTLSFWVRSSVTGTFGGSLNNSAETRSYPYTYVINAANTWEYKTITIVGDTSGTWLTTNGTGITVRWALGMGSTYIGTSGAWAAGTYASATGATSIMGTLGATFYITGVQLEKGATATPFENRLYGTELALCQRYYEVGSAYLGAYTSLAANYPTGMFTGTNFQATKRAAPTVAVTTTSSSAIYTNSGNTANITTASFSQVGLVQTQSNFGSITISWTAAIEL